MQPLLEMNTPKFKIGDRRKRKSRGKESVSYNRLKIRPITTMLLLQNVHIQNTSI